MDGNKLNDLDLKEQAKWKQIKQLIIGGLFFNLFLFFAMTFASRVVGQLLYEVIFVIIVFNLFALTLIYMGSSLFNLSVNNCSYIRFSDLIIIYIQIFKFVIGFGFLCIGFLLLTKLHGTFLIGLGIILIVIGEIALFFFVLNDSFFRKIYFKLVNFLNLDDSDYDKNLAKKAMIVYSHCEKRYVYCKLDSNNEIISYSTNRLDAFRHGFSSNFTFVGLPIDVELLNISKEYNLLKKEIDCSKLNKKIEPIIDKNNNFRYRNVYYCRDKLFSNLGVDEVRKTCQCCSRYNTKKK